MNRLKEIRMKKGLTSTQLATLAGCTQSDISNIETGKKVPRVEKMERIAVVLESSPEELFPDAFGPSECEDEVLNIRINTELKGRIKEKSSELGITMSEYVKLLIKKELVE